MAGEPEVGGGRDGVGGKGMRGREARAHDQSEGLGESREKRESARMCDGL